MISLAALLGGIDGEAVVGLFAVSAAVAVLGCSLAMSISVEVAKTHEVVMAMLALVAFWLLSLPLWVGIARTYGLPPPPDWFFATNPYVLVFAPYSWPGHFGLLAVGLFVAGSLALSAAMLAATIARLRRFVLPGEVSRRGWNLPVPRLGLPWLGARMAAIRRWMERLPGPSLDGNPVLWREWHRSKPSRMARILWSLLWIGGVLVTAIGIHDVFVHGVETMTGGFMIHTAVILQSVFGLMLVSVQAPTALGEEPHPWQPGRSDGRTDLDAGDRLGQVDGHVPGGALARALARHRRGGDRRHDPRRPDALRAGLAGAPIGPIGLADRVLAPVLIVAEMLSWGAAFTSLGMLLATWTPRVGRAIGISLAVFLLLSFGWLFLAGAVILPALSTWFSSRYNIDGIDLFWIWQGIMAFSPVAAPITTIQALDSADARRWQFWVIMSVWCLLAWAAAGAMYWLALRSFDRCLGRMRETSQEAADEEPPRLVTVEAGWQNVGR